MSGEVKLNLGAGEQELEGFTAIDISAGESAYPLPQYADGSVAEIRASHILEHFSYRETLKVLREWVRVLKEGGRLRLAVPDFDYIIRQYEEGSTEPFEGYLMGGHADNRDVHLAIFNDQKLRELMSLAGLSEVKDWESGRKDCAALPVSLNLEGIKNGVVPPMPLAPPELKVYAAMSVPRLGFMDNFFGVFQALVPLKIPLRRGTGAFWGQCLERCIGQCLEEGAEAILALDYDTVFTPYDVDSLIKLMVAHPEADAIASLQASRTRDLPMMSMIDGDGNRMGQVSKDTFHVDLARIHTAHFGCTLIRAEPLRSLPHPWFKGEPADDGTWGEDRTDDDIWFWRQWAAAGHSLYLANRVVVGHAELMIRWPGRDFRAIYQHPTEFWNDGKPEEAWE
jgi:predicted SAM-dependent methyltransferase